MQTLEGKQYINGFLRNSVDVVFLSEGRMQIKGYNLFYCMNLNSVVCPIYFQATRGENIEITKVHMEDREFIQITIDDEEPIYCNPEEFLIELKSSFGSHVS